MSSLPTDYVAIDTNIFGHIGNRSINKDKHINTLLEYLMKKKTCLLVDEGGEIAKEYKHHLGNDENLRKKYANGREPYIIGYWMKVAKRKKIPVEIGSLWNVIQQCIPEGIPEVGDENDRIFVYIAFFSGKVLISNDHRHIINRRDRLCSATNNLCQAGGDVMNSHTAHTLIP